MSFANLQISKIAAKRFIHFKHPLFMPHFMIDLFFHPIEFNHEWIDLNVSQEIQLDSSCHYLVHLLVGEALLE